MVMATNCVFGSFRRKWTAGWRRQTSRKRSGKNIDRQKYDILKTAILSALRKNDLTHTELFNRLNKSLKGKFSENISWYGETVKLDLEAKKIIERTASKPQKYRLKSR